MRRTQLYLEDDLWQALHEEAKREKTTVSEIMRQAARSRVMDRQKKRAEAMMAFIGSMPNYGDGKDSTEIIRELRKGTRFDRLQEQ